MSAISIVVLVGGILVVTLIALGVIFGITFFMLSRTAREKLEAAEQEYPNARHIEPAANFFGQQSRGPAQMRGNGTLILTDNQLIFKQWVTKKEFRIQLSDIQALETPKSFLGKTQGVPLLKVVYRDGTSTDAMAWRVRDLSEVMRLIEEARA